MNQLPKIVYKYRDWTNPFHKRILLENEIYLASPKDFNDPFDCRINQNFGQLTPFEENEYIKDLAIAGFEQAQKDGKDLQKAMEDLELRLKNKPKFQKFADTLLFTDQDKYYGIFSCCKKWNSILMWSHYASNHSGFCVGLFVEKMKNQELFGKLGEVVYETNYPLIKPRVAKKDKQMMINSFIETHTKARCWAHEKEYRFMINKFPIEFTLKNRNKTITDDYFAEVILGISMPDQAKHEIINICKAKRIPVYEAKKVEFKFKMTRKRLK